MIRGLRSAALAAGVLAVCLPALAESPVDGVFQAVDGAHTVFEVRIRRPADMAEIITDRGFWRRWSVDWPQMARLYSDPPWRYPAYLEFPADGTTTASDLLCFIVRGPAADAVPMTFAYPTTAGQVQRVPLNLDLRAAGPLPPRPRPPGDESEQPADAAAAADASSRSTDASPLSTDASEAGSGEYAPAQRWAAGEAAWFELMAEATDDPGGFWSYAAMQTRRAFDLPQPEAAAALWRNQRRPQEQAYALTTGALAIQESLQLDRMLGGAREPQSQTIAFDQIPAVQVRSHPFDQMRGEREPRHSALAGCAPADFWYARFASAGALFALLDLGEDWGGSLLELAAPVGADYHVRARTLRQLCLPDGGRGAAGRAVEALSPALVGDVAVVGSDPYLRLGTDVSVLIEVRQPAAARLALDALLHAARSAEPGAQYGQTEYHGVTIDHLITPDRRVSCHRAWIGDVCVFSNSPVAIRRIIDAAQGESPALADDPGFRYMRAAIFPHDADADADAESGFVYLSDPFVRAVVGPRQRILQSRRLEARTSLGMLTNAAMLYGWRHGPGRPTQAELAASGALRPEDLFDPAGGTFEWDPQAAAASSSVWGDLGLMRPLIEIDADKATAAEQAAYDAFRDRYAQYWRQFFDPIGVRLRLDAQRVTVETYILPLIDATAYNQLADTSGGDPIEIRVDRFGPQTLLRFVMKLGDGFAKQRARSLLDPLSGGATDWIGQWLTFWVEDSDAFARMIRREYGIAADAPGADGSGEFIDVFRARLVFGIQNRNPLSLAAFLVALRSMVESTAPNMVIFRSLEPHEGVTIVQITPDPRGELARALDSSEPSSADPDPRDNAATGDGRDGAAPTSREAPFEPSIYYASIGDGFYVSTSADALRDLIDRSKAPPADGAPAPVSANALLRISPGAAEQMRPTISLILEQAARRVAVRNLGQAWLLGRCGMLNDRTLAEAARACLGYELIVGADDAFTYVPEHDTAVSQRYGELEAPRRHEALPDDSPLRRLLDSVRHATAWLRFTDDGLATTLTLDRR